MINKDIVLPTSVDRSAILIDGSFIATFHRQKSVKNIEYIGSTFTSLISKHLLEYQRFDLIFNRYFMNNILKLLLRAVNGMMGDAILSGAFGKTPIPSRGKQVIWTPYDIVACFLAM